MSNELREDLKFIISLWDLWDEEYENTKILLRFIYNGQKIIRDISLKIQELEVKNTATMTPEELQQHCELIERFRNYNEIFTNNMEAFKQDIRKSYEALYEFKDIIDLLRNSGVLD